MKHIAEQLELNFEPDHRTRIAEPVKDDTRPALGGWSPGHYLCRCGLCKSLFGGDKRAVTCADCAYTLNVELKALCRDAGLATLAQ